MAKELGKRLDGDDAESQSAQLIRTAWGRKAEAAEIEQLSALIRESSLEDAATVIFNANEFVYIP